jgi:hypothetical protein
VAIIAKATADDLRRVQWADGSCSISGTGSLTAKLVVPLRAHEVVSIDDLVAWGDANGIRWADPADIPIS